MQHRLDQVDKIVKHADTERLPVNHASFTIMQTFLFNLSKNHILLRSYINELMEMGRYSIAACRYTRAHGPAVQILSTIQFPKTTGKWIRVDLSEQIVVAYEGQKPIRAFHISSGLPGTPTVTGEFHIRMKVLSQTMTGGEGNMYYNLPNVKWVQYFY